MPRHTRNKGHAGSEKWLQKVVNECPDLLEREIRHKLKPSPSEIQWLSPLETDDYSEYSDQEFLDRLEISLPKFPLGKFWPNRGPHWDGLGKTDEEQILLIEAKANIGELGSKNSKGSRAGEKSLSEIRASMDLIKKHIGTPPNVDWAKSRYYQYANRLAHLYLLRVLNELPAYLVMIYFLNDEERGGPAKVSEWKNAIAQEMAELGIPENHPLDKYIISAFVDVRDIPVK